MNSWLLDNGLTAILLLAGVIAVVYVSRTKIADRISASWKEVAEANQARIVQLEAKVAEQAQQIDVLSAQVELLGSRPDLTAAIHELALHEVAAQDRHAALLTEIRQLIAQLGGPAHA